MPAPARLLRGGLYFAAAFLLCLSYWLHKYFGRPDLDQIAYHLSFGVDLVRFSDPVLTRRFIDWCLLIPLALLAMLLAWDARAPRFIDAAPRISRRFLARAQDWLPNALLLGMVVFWANDMAVARHLAAQFGRDYFGAHYIPPATARMAAHKPKNLILVYVESLEAAYADSRLWGRDLVAPLTALGGSHFEAYRQAPGTGWTIAAIVSTQCGLPLERVTLFDINTQGQMVDSFLNNATCLGDILAAHGYRNVFLGGAAEEFAGKGKFLRQHHYGEVDGKEEWLKAGLREADMNGWGMYDADLFERARIKLDELHRAGKPFNLTVLTVDTHEPDGHLSRQCAARGYSGFEGVITCTAEDAAAFVRFAQERGYLEDTNVVILGDHLARSNPLSAQLGTVAHRAIFNAFIGRDAPLPSRSQLLHFDLLPSILEFVGFDLPDGRMGLGYSAFNRHAQAPANGRLEEMEADLLNRSPSYLALWRQ
ncbi:MAG: sulfatase-like hydrolase/transferase [Telluria sp.]